MTQTRTGAPQIVGRQFVYSGSLGADASPGACRYGSRGDESSEIIPRVQLTTLHAPVHLTCRRGFPTLKARRARLRAGREKRVFSTNNRAVQLLVLLSLGISLVGLFGAVAGRPILTSWVPGRAGATPDTCLGILLAGVGLWLAQRKSARLVRSLTLCLLLLDCLNIAFKIPGAALTHLLAPQLN